MQINKTSKMNSVVLKHILYFIDFTPRYFNCEDKLGTRNEVIWHKKGVVSQACCIKKELMGIKKLRHKLKNRVQKDAQSEKMQTVLK